MNATDTLIKILSYCNEECNHRYDISKNYKRYNTDEKTEHYLIGRTEEAIDFNNHITRIIKEYLEGGETN